MRSLRKLNFVVVKDIVQKKSLKGVDRPNTTHILVMREA